MYMEGMTIQDVMALNEITRKDHNEGRWSMATSLWVIVGIIFVIALLWYVHRTGADTLSFFIEETKTEQTDTEEVKENNEA